MASRRMSSGASSGRTSKSSTKRAGSISGAKSGGNGGAAKRTAKAPAERPPRRIGWRIAKWSLILGIWGSVALGGVIAWYGWDLPNIGDLETPVRRPSITLTAADGGTLAQRGDIFAGRVAFEEVPPMLVQAVVATEDRRFFDHSGVDPWAILRALYVNIRAGRVRQGGSTLTQQLAKNLFLTPDRTLRRKVQEALAAFLLEARFSKKQIFTIYINRVYFGSGAYGLTGATRRYFGRSPSDINLHEAAVLAGLLKAPSRYSPLRNKDAALKRARIVLGAMVDAGFLAKRDAARAGSQPVRLQSPSGGTAGRYFADWALERAAARVGLQGRDLVVSTTLDPRIQRIAAEALDAELKRSGSKFGIGQGAVVVMDRSGAVRAMVGGRSYRQSQYNRVTQALRQPGSAFKLFVYLAGLEAGLSPDSRVSDAPINIKGWKPRNYTGRFRGPVTLRTAMAESLNTAAVRVSERAGRGRVIAAARRLGITSRLKSHPSIALGASEVTLLELTGAYAALAAGGRVVWPHGIRSIEDPDGRDLYTRRVGAGAQVVGAREVNALHDMLGAVIVRGTGRTAALGRPAAGKSGTSQAFRDAWFIGYTGDLIAGVWLGNDDGRPMKRVTGGGAPARIWKAVMAGAERGSVAAPLVAPRSTVTRVERRPAPPPGDDPILDNPEYSE